MNANRLKAYFNFSKKERNGILVLLIVLIAVWFLPAAFTPGEHFDEKGFERFKNEIAQLAQSDYQSNDEDVIEAAYATQTGAIHPEPGKAETFYFDPNTLPAAEWHRLGIADKTVHTIQSYLAKGGRFYQPEDLAKIYGLKALDYNRLVPYVRITRNHLQTEKSGNKEFPKPFTDNSNHAAPAVHINTADTTDFVGLPGIGSKLAIRIVSFREKLGGFYSIDQLAEVYGISDSVFQQIKPKLQCDPAYIKKINVNTITLEELKTHPYIKYQVANAVIQYRRQHGDFRSPDDLKQIHLITDEQLKKWIPYVIY
ncbi:MAG TPA: helix-hairpin-helix domain-containing protein [Agriterribacter sp.]|nr:helix-hairpin-helix domain-containing protein [Agriterribacter sp.]